MPRRRRGGSEEVLRADAGWLPASELRQGVRALARRWSRDRPDVQEDLEQEALEAIWLKGMTGAPLSHQLRTAQNRMLSFRKLGKSVDGKLDRAYHRTRMYVVLSLEEQVPHMNEEPLLLIDLLPSAFSVEEHVVRKLMLLESLSVLNAAELQCVVLLCQGYTLHDIAAVAKCDLMAARQLLQKARGKLYPLLYGRRGSPQPR